jgi:hypothetical protein
MLFLPYLRLTSFLLVGCDEPVDGLRLRRLESLPPPRREIGAKSEKFASFD